MVQYRMQFHRDLPATLLRGYVQLSTSVVPGNQVPLSNANLDPAQPATPIAGYTGVDNPHYLGPTIVATKDRPVRILFRNLLPTGTGGDLFLPVDTSLMGSGAWPEHDDARRATVCPWTCTRIWASSQTWCAIPCAVSTLRIWDASPRTAPPCTCTAESPPGSAMVRRTSGPRRMVESTDYPQGVSVSNVPDMPDPGPGALTFFYTNQQSARLMFYHDHAWGITRLNVYAGEAAGYVLTDATEQTLFVDDNPDAAINTAPFKDLGVGTPLVVQDKTFVPSPAKIAQLDPTWDAARWGGEGSLWTPHVYMPAQNPGDPSGHELVRALDVRAVVLAARQGRQVPADRQPILQHGPVGGSALQPAVDR